MIKNENLNNEQLINKITPIECESNGDIPLPRFGHSLVLLSSNQFLIFGGVVEHNNEFEFTNETFLFNLISRTWSKIIFEENNTLPKGRAAHAACANNKNQMLIHGGSNQNQILIEDELWLFNLNKDNNKYGIWRKIDVENKGPGSRYGHTLNYLHNFFILYGGSINNNKLLNDVWIIDLTSKKPNWICLEFQNSLIPSPRLYHTSIICNYGAAKGMMIIFGGRDSNKKPLNDIYGLRRHRNGSWTWTKAEINNNLLIARYNHSVVIYDNLMIIIGGKGNNTNIFTLPIQVFDINTSQIFNFPNLEMIRHSSVIFEKNIYLYGGFDDDKYKTKPIQCISMISIKELFKNCPLIKIIEGNNQIINNNLIKKENENIKINEKYINKSDEEFKNNNKEEIEKENKELKKKIEEYKKLINKKEEELKQNKILIEDILNKNGELIKENEKLNKINKNLNREKKELEIKNINLVEKIKNLKIQK